MSSNFIIEVPPPVVLHHQHNHVSLYTNGCVDACTSGWLNSWIKAMTDVSVYPCIYSSTYLSIHPPTDTYIYPYTIRFSPKFPSPQHHEGNNGIALSETKSLLENKKDKKQSKQATSTTTDANFLALSFLGMVRGEGG